MPIKKTLQRAALTVLALALANGASLAADASVDVAAPTNAARIAGPYTNAPADQVLARVGDHDIRAIDLEQALASSPVSTSFVSMNEDDQARVRGDILITLAK